MTFRLRPAFRFGLLLGRRWHSWNAGAEAGPRRPPPVVDGRSEYAGHRNDPPIRSTTDPSPSGRPPARDSGAGQRVDVRERAGRTGWCGSPALGPLARLLDRFDGDILLAGDLAYRAARWRISGVLRAELREVQVGTRAAPGNHDYVAW